MNKLFSLLLILSFSTSFGQSFSPEPGIIGTTAIHKDSSCFVGWATGGSIQRGYINIADTNATAGGSNRASFGTLSNAFGPATNSTTSVVSLGDSGIAILTFDQLIINGAGYDFAIFENGFVNHYMELAHVEVSSDGVNYFRFPSTSEIQTSSQLGNASTSDCRLVNNMAGKYRVGYGTPFDLADLPNDVNLDKQAIQHVKIIDAIGAINGSHKTYDQNGTVINDPFPTPFESGGFDLEAVGIINGILSEKEIHEQLMSVYPNPTNGNITIQTEGEFTSTISNLEGKVLHSFNGSNQTTSDLSAFDNGFYILKIDTNQKSTTFSIQVLR